KHLTPHTMNTMNTMNTNSRPTLDELIDQAKQVDTTSENNGYPSHLRVMYTANTMAELRDLYEAAVAEGHKVNVWELYRQNGWRLWYRANTGTVYDLDDYRWMSRDESQWTADIDANSDRLTEACRAVCGDVCTVQDAAD